MLSISLKKLHPNPQNPNVCPGEISDKIRRNIERTGYYPPLIVRPHPKVSGCFQIIDGHYRKEILESLGKTSAHCVVWDVSDQEAGILLATLNRLHGEDNPRKRAELLESLMVSFTPEDLSALIPESTSEIEDLLSLLEFNFDEMEKTLQKTMAEEAASLPVPFTFMISSEEAPVVEEALGLFSGEPKSDRSDALVKLCRKVLDECHGKT
jgi:ParB family chromosome partitioning protein